MSHFTPVIGSFAALIEPAPPKPTLSPANASELLELVATMDAGDRKPVPFADLLERSGMRFDRFGRLLRKLEEGGFVNVIAMGDLGDEKVLLTAAGESAANLHALEA